MRGIEITVLYSAVGRNMVSLMALWKVRMGLGNISEKLFRDILLEFL